MKIRKYIPALLISTLIYSSLLAGCKQDSDEPAATVEKIPAETIESIPETTVTESLPEETITEASSEAEELKSITISVFNASDITVGMFSVMDPVTGEQINLDGMESGDIISLECNWPVDTDKFHWALYNEAGELCIEASTDISNVSTGVALKLSGEGTIDDVEVVSE